MNGIEKIAAFAVLAAISVLILRSFGWQGAKVIGILAFALTVSGAVSTLGKLGLAEKAAMFGISSENAAFAGKVMGIGMIGGMCADLCTELGEEKIAKGVMLSMRVEIFVLTFPILENLLQKGMALLTE